MNGMDGDSNKIESERGAEDDAEVAKDDDIDDDDDVDEEDDCSGEGSQASVSVRRSGGQAAASTTWARAPRS